MNIATCETCNNDGWIISNDESWNTEIQRCDECQQFKSDEEAVLENAYREFKEYGRNIHSTSGFYTQTLVMCAKEWGVDVDDLADYTAQQWGIYPYDSPEEDES